MVLVDLAWVDGEAIRLLDESRKDSRPLHRRLGQGLGRIDSDDFHPSRVGRVVKEREEAFHAVRLNRSLNIRNG